MPNEDNLDEYTVDELRDLAADEDIDIPSHAVKADIIKAIKKARKTAAAGADAPATGAAEVDESLRAPLPETVDHDKESERLVKADRERFEHQGDK